MNTKVQKNVVSAVVNLLKNKSPLFMNVSVALEDMKNNIKE
jgi:hypothetical protein